MKRKTHGLKRPIAMLLAVCMLLGLMPAYQLSAVTAKAADTPEDIVIDFTGVNTDWSNEKLVITSDYETDGWAIDTQLTAPALVSSNGKFTNSVGMRAGGDWLDIRSAVGDRQKYINGDFALKFEAKAAGSYQLDVTYGMFTSGIEFAVFVNGKYMGFRSSYSSAKDVTPHTSTMNVVDLVQGENTIVFRRINSGTTLHLNKIHFKPLDSAVTRQDIFLNPAKVMITVGETVEVEYGIRMSNNTFYELNGWSYTAGAYDQSNKVTIESSDTGVAALAASAAGLGNPKAKTTITGVTAGKANITVNAIIDGTTYPKTVEVNVVDALPEDQVIDFTTINPENNGGVKVEGNLTTMGWTVNAEMSDPTMQAGNGGNSSTGGTMRVLKDGLDVRPAGYGTKITSDITLTIDVKADGVYTPVIDFYQFDTERYAALVDVFIDEKYVGSYDSYNAIAGAASETMNTVYLTKGTHEFTFRRTTSRLYFFITRINLNSVAALPQLDWAFCDIPVDELVAGSETAAVSYGVKMTDGSILKQGSSYEGGADANNTTSIAVRDNTIASLSGTTLAGIVAGTATLDVTAIVDGVTYKASDSVTIADAPADPEDIMIDFGLINPTWDGDKLAIAGNLYADGWQLNTEYTDPALVTNNGKFTGGVGMRVAGDYIDVRTSTRARDGLAGSNFSIDVNAKATAPYSFSITYSKYKDGAEMAVFVNEKYVGLINTIDRSVSANPYPTGTFTFNSVMLNEGANKITFRRVGSATIFFLNKIELKVLDEMPAIKSTYLDIDKVMLKSGETAAAKYGVRMTDDTDLLLNGWIYSAYTYDQNNKIALESSNTAVATVSGSTITAVGNGTAVITANAIVDGQSYPKSVEINVADELPADQVFDFTTINPADSSRIPVTSDFDTDGWMVNTEMTDPTMVANNGGHGNITLMRALKSGIDARPGSYGTKITSDLTLTLDVKANGAYIPQILYTKFSPAEYACAVDVYIDKEYVGSFDSFGTGPETEDMNTVYLTAGTHEITFRRANSARYFIVGKVTLKSVAAIPQVQGAFCEISADEIKLGGDPATVSYGIRLTDGSVLKQGSSYEGGVDANNTTTAAVRDGKFVTLSGTTLTATAEGTAYVDVVGMVDGFKYTASDSIVVANRPMIPSLSIKESYGAVVGVETELQMTAKMDTQRIGFDGADITATAEDAAVADVSVRISDDKEHAYLQINGKKAGTTKVTLTGVFSDGSQNAAAELELTILEKKPDSFEIDFTVYNPTNANDKLRIRNAIGVDGWEVNVPMTDATMWANETCRTGYFARLVSTGIDVRPPSFDTEKTADLTLDINIPESGAYKPTIEFSRIVPQYGAQVAVFIDEEYVGRYNCSQVGTETSAQEVMNSVYLEKGTHQFTFRKIDSKVQFFVSKLFLDGIDAAPVVTGIETEGKKLLSVGESTTLRPYIALSDGGELNVGKLFAGGNDTASNIICTNNTTNILQTVSDGNFKAIASGAGKLTYNATVNGEPYVLNQDIVVDAKVLNKVELSLDRQELSWGDTANIVLSAFIDDRQVDAKDITVEYTVDDASVLQLSGATVKAIKAGDATLTARVTLASTTVTQSIDVAVKSKVEIAAIENCQVALGSSSKYLLDIKLDGEQYDVGDTPISVVVDNPEVADGMIQLSEDRSRAYLVLSGKVADASGNVTVSMSTNDVTGTMTVPFTVEEANALYDFEMSIDSAALEVGTTGKITLVAYGVDGAELADATVYFETSNPQAAVVANDGTVTARSAGSVTVTAHVAKGDVKLTKTLSLTVGGESDIESVTLQGAATVAIGASAAMSVTGELFNGFAADLSSATIVYSATENDGVIELDPATGKVTGLAAGTAKIKATVTTVAGTYETQEKTITVREGIAPPVEPDPVPGDIVIDFRVNQSATPIDATMSSHGWQVDRTNTAAALVSGVQILRWQPGGLDVRPPSYDTKGNGDVAFTFNVPTAGAYKPEIEYFTNATYGTVVAAFVDETYIGSYDCSVSMRDTTSELLYDKVLCNSVYLEAGEHTLTLRRTNSKIQLFVSSFALRLKDSMPMFERIVAEADKSLMSVGETAAITAGALMSDGTFLQMGKAYQGGNDTQNSIQITSRDTSKLTVSGTTVKAVGVGASGIDMKVAMDGVEGTYGIDITVDDKGLDSIDVSLDGTLYLGGKANLNIVGYTDDMREIAVKDMSVGVSADSTDIITISGAQLTGVGLGTQRIKVAASMNGKTVEKEIDVEVVSPVLAQLTLASTGNTVMKPDAAGIQLTASATDNMGGAIAVTPQSLTWSSSEESIIKVDANGFVTPVAEGVAYVIATAQSDLGTIEGQIEISVTNGKTSSSFYTADKVANARANIEKYDWAKRLKNTAVNTVESKFDWSYDELWNYVTTNELPRGMAVGYWHDPEQQVCRYCGVNQTTASGSRYPWLVDQNNSPWKIQCRACRRKFPSNDFGSFYELGIDEHGNWSYELAKAKHIEMFGGLYGVGYLKNDLYPEVSTVKTLNGGRGLRENESVETWGVDDGWGYKTGYSYTTANGTIQEVHTYIAQYNQYVWMSSYGGGTGIASIMQAMINLRDAYLYTGDMKYGRMGAILVDRVADVYPDMYVDHFHKTITNNGSGEWPRGRILGSISENEVVNPAMLLYDAVYDCFEDPTVVSFLSEKAEKYNFENDKSTPRKIRENIENNLLREVRESVIVRDNNGNFGMHQSSMAYAAVVLDSHPETEQMIDWIFTNTDKDINQINEPLEGGDVARKLINSINRDGGGEEGSVAYNMLWIERLKLIADALADYPDETKNLYRNPRYIKMFTAFAPMIMNRRTLINLGDAGNTADENIGFTTDTLMDAYVNSGNPVIGQLIYFANGNKTDGLHSDIFSADAEKVRTDIENLIETEGEYNFSESRMQTGYGFAVLRDGDLYESGLGNVDTQRAFSLAFGQAAHHGHQDMLNLSIFAYGLDFAPEFGYPGYADGSAFYYNWGKNNLSHNTVMIDNTQMHGLSPQNTGLPKHFDDSGRVKVMDVEGEQAYDNVKASIFRRTVVMIEASDEVSYGVDFFRVRGGSDHKYVFHALSDTISDTENLTFVPQTIGTYAGVDVPYGSVAGLYKNGFDYLTNVRRAQYPGVNEFAVDFKITDFRNTLKNPSLDLHLKMTMLNDFEPDEVALADGSPYNYNGNPQNLQFVLVDRKGGANLDSLFTTVYEPYNGESYILSEEQVPMDVIGGTPGAYDTAKAVKVTFKNGRVDYIVYATNNKVAYNVDGLFDFRGFVAVYTMQDGKPVYTYLNDGDLLDGQTSTSAYTGKVVGLTKDIVLDNYITVEFDAAVDPEGLAGEYIYINNGNVTKNAVYEIVDAEHISGNSYKLDIGEITLVRMINGDGSYTYNIEEGQTFRMPRPAVTDNSPVFAQMQDEYTASSGYTFTVPISAQSQLGNDIIYTATALPRGASFDADTGLITWRPDDYQLGDNHFSVTASDGVLESTVHFTVKVIKSSAGSADTGSTGTGSTGTGTGTGTGSTGTGTGSTGTGSTGTGTGTGTGSGSTGTTTPSTPDTPDAPDTPDTPDTPDAPAERFIDLAGYDWAKDAINSLAEAGVINGTSQNTYSPGLDITRADFAILMVRAFGLESDSTENFADVAPDAYYADELAVAKAHGIVNGVGENKYNPTATITRQDMMTIVSRALTALEYELADADAQVLAQFADAAEVAEYAAEHVARLVANELVMGSNGRINPAANTTRAEVAVLIKRLMDTFING